MMPYKPIGGGYLQRAGRALDPNRPVVAVAPTAAPTATPPSKLAEIWNRELLWGRVSAAMVARMATAAVADGLNHPEIKLLAGMRGKGSHTGNEWRTYKMRMPVPATMAAF